MGLYKEDKDMKKIFILCLLCSILLCGCTDNKDNAEEDEFNVPMWVANPANPASPLHMHIR